MPDDDLTPVQRSVLLILMGEARELPNAELAKDRKLELKKDRRDDLVRRRLINVRTDRRRLFLELSERGWHWCSEQPGGIVPAGAGHGGSAAYSILAGVRRYLDRHDLSLAEFFSGLADLRPARESGPAPEAAERPGELIAPTDIETRIRKAYQELVVRPGIWLKLSELRPRLGGLPRVEVDRALVRMNGSPDVSIVPESNQKTLTNRDRASAIQIGNQDKHLIAIGPA